MNAPRIVTKRVLQRAAILARQSSGVPIVASTPNARRASPVGVTSATQWSVPRQRRRYSSSTSPRQQEKGKDESLRLVSILEDRELLTQIPLEDVRNFCFIGE